MDEKEKEKQEKPEPGWEVIPESELEKAVEGAKASEAVEEKPEAKPDEFGRRAEKRIRELVKRAKQAEERAAVAESRVGRFEEDFTSLRQELQSLKQGSQANTKEAIQQRYLAARNSLKLAKENGDTMAEIAAIEAMTAAQADWRLAANVPAVREASKVEQSPAAADGGGGGGGGGGLHPKARKWIEGQDWWDEDDVARGAAIAMAARLEREGYDPTEDDHYEELTKRLSKRFPEHFNEMEEQPKARQVVAGGSRTSASGGNGRPKVRLTESQVKLAEKMGVPVEVYARNLAKLDAAKRPDGTYGPIDVEIPVRGKWA